MKKKLILIIIPMIIIICIIIGLVIYFNSNQYKLKGLENVIKKVGCSYYEDYYYPTLGIEKIKNNKSIVISLDTIKNTNFFQKNDDLNKLDICDKDNTYVKISPKEPFKSTDYSIEINLDCNFDK